MKSSLPNDVKINIINDDIRLKSNLTTNKTIRFINRSYLYSTLGFTQSHSVVLGDIPGFVQLIPGSYESDKPINITGIDKVHMKCDCISGSIVNAVREPFLFSFGLTSPPGYKTYKVLTVKLLKKIN